MNTPYHHFVSTLASHLTDGLGWQKGGFPTPQHPELPDDAPKVMIFSPHPDDECIIGGIALRLLRECQYRVVNVAMTLGSAKARQQPRLAELRNACDYIGFDLVQTCEAGLEGLNMKTRENDPERWQGHVDCLASILDTHRPEVVMVMHETDANTSHIGSHFAVIEALQRQDDDYTCSVIETEYWSQMPSPNIMVESSAQDLSDLVAALTFHVGEVERNPYHLTMPSWMIDNVRRAEIVGGQGSAAPSFDFATLYRLRQWRDGRLNDVFDGGRFLAKDDDPASLFA